MVQSTNLSSFGYHGWYCLVDDRTIIYYRTCACRQLYYGKTTCQWYGQEDSRCLSYYGTVKQLEMILYFSQYYIWHGHLCIMSIMKLCKYICICILNTGCSSVFFLPFSQLRFLISLSQYTFLFLLPLAILYALFVLFLIG